MPQLLLATAIASLALAGCGGTPPDPAPGDESATPSASASATASATPDAAGPTIDPNILFTITVTSTAPDGGIAHLTQTVYEPVAATSQQAADEAALDGECDGWRSEFAAPQFLVSLIEVTDESPAGLSWTGAAAVVSMNGWPTYTGAVDTFQAYCASYQVNVGSSRAVSPIGPDAEGPHGWAHVEYGFGIATAFGDTEPGDTYDRLSDCTITLSAEAAASPTASAWPTPTDPLDCIFGEYDF